MPIEEFEIARRYCGPPRSGNGGYTSGRVAKHLRGAAAVRLKAPPPLATPLRLEYGDDAASLYHDKTLIAEARTCALDLQVPPSPGYEEAVAASRSYIGFKAHAFPGCFVCGPQRVPEDGLRIFPGALTGSSTIAAPWIPDRSLVDARGMVESEYLWAALDCVAAFTVTPENKEVAIVLGEQCTSILGDLRAGEKCVVIGWPLNVEGRKRYSASAIYAPNGRLVAIARLIFIEVSPTTWA